MDDNVEVIYISPFQLDHEAVEYIVKLLQSRGIKNVSQRFQIIYPENHIHFDKLNTSLSNLLMYSPRAMKRLQMSIKGKTAYIIPGVVSSDDLKLALVIFPFMDLPFLEITNSNDWS